MRLLTQERARGVGSVTISRRQAMVGTAKLAAGSALVVALGQNRLSALAQEASPAPGAVPSLPPGCTPVAQGLLNPRFVTVAQDGTIYVSEAGTGGTEEILAPAGMAGTPVEGEGDPTGPIGFRGTTGQVTRVTPEGEQSVVASGLPSYGAPPELIGPAGIAAVNDELYLAIGAPAFLTTLIESPLPNEGTVVRVNPETGELTTIADLVTFERENNPHPANVDSNLYGLSVGQDGSLIVADAGGNDVFRVDPSTGEVTLLGVIENLPLPEGMAAEAEMGGGTPTAGIPEGLEAVPTATAVGPDGTIYVGLLGSLVPGAAKVVRLDEGGAFADVATGLTAVTGLAVGPDGNLYASQFTMDIAAEQPAPGNVVRIGQDGTTEVVLPDLPFPGGITFDQEGNLYVVIGAITIPGVIDGMVIRCEDITGAHAATPTA